MKEILPMSYWQLSKTPFSSKQSLPTIKTRQSSDGEIEGDVEDGVDVGENDASGPTAGSMEVGYLVGVVDGVLEGIVGVGCWDGVLIEGGIEKRMGFAEG